MLLIEVELRSHVNLKACECQLVAFGAARSSGAFVLKQAACGWDV
jgi:hypothetical protein